MGRVKTYVLASTDTTVPVSEVYHTIPQTNITLNCFLNSIVNPIILSHAFLYGNIGFNATPRVTPEAGVLIHSKYIMQRTLAEHGKYGCYIRS